MKPSMLSAWKKTATAAALGAALWLAPVNDADAQTGPVAANTNKAKTETVTEKEPVKGPVVQILDIRDRKPYDGTSASLSASQKGYVVVLVRGCEQRVIDAVEGSLKAMMWTGRIKVGMVIGSKTDQEEPQIIVLSKGDIAARIYDPSGTSTTKNLVERAIRKAYDLDIGAPKQVTASASLQPSPQEP